MQSSVSEYLVVYYELIALFHQQYLVMDAYERLGKTYFSALVGNLNEGILVECYNFFFVKYNCSSIYVKCLLAVYFQLFLF